MGKVFAIKVEPEFESPKHIKTTVEGVCNELSYSEMEGAEGRIRRSY